MALLASVRPLAGAETNIYTVPSGQKAAVNVTIMNTTSASGSLVDFGIQFVAGAFTAKDLWLSNALVAMNRPIQFTGIVLTAGNNIRALSNNGSVNIHINGIQEAV